MKKKNLFRTAALLAVASVSFAGCSEGDDVKGGDSSVAGVVRATVQDPPDNEKVDAVRLSDGSYEAATGTYKDGSLEFTLPPTVTGDHLSVLEVGSDLPPDITPSPADAKMWRSTSIFAYKGGSQIGEFVYGSKSGTTQIRTTFAYVDRDVTITGSSSRGGSTTITFDITAKKGWNKIYEIQTNETYKTTTKDPGGLTWTFEESNSGGGDSSVAGLVKETVQNPPSNEKVDAVKLEIEWYQYDDDSDFGFGYDHGYYEVVTGTYQDGSFEFTLPATVLDDYLSVFGTEGKHSGLTVSDANAKIGGSHIFAYKDGNQVGEFNCDFESVIARARVIISFVYADRDFSITGSYTDNYLSTYNISLKQGWNKWYELRGGPGREYTTTDPGVQQTWTFNEY